MKDEKSLQTGQASLSNENYRSRIIFNSVWVVLVIVLLVITLGVGSASSGEFLSGRNLTNILQSWFQFAVLVPATVLILAAGGLDLSVGSVVGCSAILTASLASSLGLAGAALAGVLFGLVIGLINGLIVSLTRIHGAIVTIGMAALLRGLAIAFGVQPTPVENSRLLDSQPLLWLTLIVAIALGGGLAFLQMRVKPRLGLNGEQPSWGARLIFVGVPYGLSGLFASCVGMFLIGRLGVVLPTTGTGMEIVVITVAVLGGTPLGILTAGFSLVNILGALLASLVIAMMQNIIALNGASSSFVEIIYGLVLLVFGLISYVYYWLASRIASKKSAVEPATPMKAGS